MNAKLLAIIDIDDLFRQVPEGMEFLAAVLTILFSLAIMVVLGSWWSR